MTIRIDDSVIIDMTNKINKKYNCDYNPKDIEHITFYKHLLWLLLINLLIILIIDTLLL